LQLSSKPYFQSSQNNYCEVAGRVTNEFILQSRAQQYIKLLQPKQIIDKSVVRIGSEFDGGYIFVDDLDEKDLFISAGIAEDFSVDQEVVDRVGQLIMIDPSIQPVNFSNANQIFIKKPLSPRFDKDGISLEELLDASTFEDAILKIDIEGGEWPVFNSLEEKYFDRFRQIIVELHWLTALADSEIHNLRINALNKLKKSHECIAIHGNNYGKYEVLGGVPLPDVIELTLARKSSYTFEGGISSKVLQMESPCNPNKPEIKIWWI